jgi:uncharacterized protein
MTGPVAIGARSRMRAWRSPDLRLPCSREVKYGGAPVVAVDDRGVFEGYASLFGVVDLGKDLVERGAFSDSLVKRGISGIKLLWSHDPAEPIGHWLELTEDMLGLKVKGKLNLAVGRAREVHALMQNRSVDGLSIGFKTERARRDPRRGIRRLQKIDLWEVSLVTFPMLPEARVSAVKQRRFADSPVRTLIRAIETATAHVNP